MTDSSTRDLPAELLQLDNQLCFALHAASRCMTSTYQPVLEALGITYPQYLVMLVLWEEDGLRVSRIGERLLLDSATLTPMLKRLEAHGLVERRRSQSDERVVEVFLTPQGQDLRCKAFQMPATALARSGLTLERLAEMRDSLQALTTTLRAAQSSQNR